MPTPACEPLRPTDRTFPRPVLPDRPFNKVSKFRSAHTKTAAKALATLGVKLMPTHGMVWTGKGYECDCMEWVRRLAKKTGAPVQPCAQPGKRPRLRGWPDAATSDPSQLDAWTDPTRGGNPPKTEALMEQIIQGFTAEQSWWMMVLEDGALPSISSPRSQADWIGDKEFEVEKSKVAASYREHVTGFRGRGVTDQQPDPKKHTTT